MKDSFFGKKSAAERNSGTKQEVTPNGWIADRVWLCTVHELLYAALGLNQQLH